MQVQISAKNFQITPDLQHVIDKKTNVLSRLCRLFKPDVVMLQLTISQANPRKGYEINLNLAVPHQQFASSTHHKKFSLALGQAVDKVSAQLRKHRAKLKKV